MFKLRRLLVDVDPRMPPANGTRPNHAYISETNFDTNMVIVLAALLCALLCALGLNSMVRCARRFGTETPEQAAARSATTGVKKRTLQKIPVAVYGSGVNLMATECPICLGDFEEGEKVRVLPNCNHGFHVKCIDTWLVSHPSCPNCRHSLLERPTSRVADENSAAQPPQSRPGRQISVTVVVDAAAAAAEAAC